MSQYPPSPYAMPYVYPAGYGYDPMSAYLVPAKRAGMLLIILGSLIAVYSLCNTLALVVASAEQLLAQNRRMGVDPMFSGETLKVVGLVFSILAGVLGFVMIALGFPTRRGSTVAHIIALVLMSIIALFLGAVALFCLVSGLQAVEALIASCAAGLVLAIFVLQIVWLIQGLRACSRAQAMRVQYQAQYFQYQQQQQMYAQQGGHGYAQAQQPPPNNPAGGGSNSTSAQG